MRIDWFMIPQALWLFLPAYVANMAPVFAMRLFPNWNRRLDGGRVWKDGRPLLGAGKTWRGLWAGCLAATATAYAQSFIRFSDVDFSDFGHELAGGAIGPLAIGFALGFGAIIGDAVKSFFKRRTGRLGGAPWVPFDQLDFVVGGLLFAYLGALILQLLPRGPPNWWASEFGGAQWPKLVVLLVLTPLLHLVVNVVGYKLRLKKVPW